MLPMIESQSMIPVLWWYQVHDQVIGMISAKDLVYGVLCIPSMPLVVTSSYKLSALNSNIDMV